MKKLIHLLIVSLTIVRVAHSQRSSFHEAIRLFGYDPNAPLDVKETLIRDEDGIKVHDISYVSRLLSCKRNSRRKVNGEHEAPLWRYSKR